MDQMVQTMCLELDSQKEYLVEKKELNTVYFGGGTPSLLTIKQLSFLFEGMKKHFQIKAGAEVTLEANPDDLTPQKLQGLRQLGINRLSIGTQSFSETDMDWMKRRHTPAQAVASVKNARKAGFQNISLDLIFGTPNMNMQQWRENLEKLLALDPEHISLYALAVTEKTLLHHWVQKEMIELPDDARCEEQYLFAHDLLTSAGYEHYELSSFAKKGFRSQHNSAYWHEKPYLGIGPSAHSFNGTQRRWNIANNAKYLRDQSFESETLSLTDRYNEFVMTRLRCVEGIDLKEIQNLFNKDLNIIFEEYIQSLEEQGRLWRRGDWIGFTPAGWIISDKLTSGFFQ